MPESKEFHGRTRIYTNVTEVTAENVGSVVKRAMETHTTNGSDISSLWDYYRGDQAILDREKTYNTTINNKVVDNRFKQIVDWKSGYFLANPIQYIDAKSNGAEVNDDLATMNRWLAAEDKDASDMEVEQWRSCVGTAYRMPSPKGNVRLVGDGAKLPDNVDEQDGELELCVLDPRYTFVVYAAQLGHRPVLGVTYVEMQDDSGSTVRTYYAYSDSQVFTLSGDYAVVSTDDHGMSAMPIVEYPNNMALMGDAEPVVSNLDAINTAQSSRVDGIEQFVQSILVIKAADMEDDWMAQLKEDGGLLLPQEADAKYLSLDMNQDQEQTLVDSLWEDARQVVMMPQEASGTESDTGMAATLKHGWTFAESAAEVSAKEFARSERRFLNLCIDFYNTRGLNLLHTDVGIRFPRRNYTNDTANVDNFNKLMATGYVDPSDVFELSHLFPDSYAAFLRGMAYHDEQEEGMAQEMASANQDELAGDVAEQGSEVIDDGTVQG